MIDLRRAQVRSQPYPIALFDGALEATNYQELKADLPPLERFQSQVRMHGDLSHGDAEYANLLSASPAWRKLDAWVFSPAFAHFVFGLFYRDIDHALASGEMRFDPRKLRFDSAFREGRQGQLTEVEPPQASLFSRLDVGYGLEGYGKVNGGKGIHIDNWPRIASLLIYFSDQSDFDGGEFCVYALKGLEVELESTISIAENRAIISLQSNEAFHAVNEVVKVRRPRFAAYAALSCNASVWRYMPSERQAQLSQSRVSRYRPGQLPPPQQPQPPKTMLQRVLSKLTRR